jgi:DNA-binding transcriptional MerR regulator
MDEDRRNLILHKRVRRIADEHGCSVAEVNAVLDHHPIETNRDQYLKRALALELLHLDEIVEAFRDKALVDRDVPSAMVLIKAAERRATLLGLNPVLGHAVSIVQHPPENRQTSTDKIEAALNKLIADRRRSEANGNGESH